MEDLIRQCLKDHYKDECKIRRVSGDYLEDLEACYVNLAIIDRQMQQKKERKALDSIDIDIITRLPSYETIYQPGKQELIKLNDLFEESPKEGSVAQLNTKRVLIMGRAGIGKSTLCKKIVYEYYKDKDSILSWKNKFNWLLWISLRNVKEDIHDLEKLFYEQYFWKKGNKKGNELAGSLFEYIDDPKGSEKTLFILDGWDEITHHPENSKSAQLLKDLLNKPFVIVTSRPYGVPNASIPFNLELETVGFSQKNVHDYIEKVVEDSNRQQEISAFIQQNSVVAGLVNIPVQLDILCYSWDIIKKDRDITMTTLYRAMVCKLWLVATERLNSKEIKILDSTVLSQYEESEINAYLEEEMEKAWKIETAYLKLLAFNGLCKRKIEFSAKSKNSDFAETRKTLPKIYPFCSSLKTDTESWKLEHRVKQTSFLNNLGPGADKNDPRYHFIHLTFQEFFAAKYIVNFLVGYDIHAMSSTKAPEMCDLKSYMGKAPLLFMHNKTIWVYWLNAKKEPQLHKLRNNNHYKDLQEYFAEIPTILNRTNSTEIILQDIYQDILQYRCEMDFMTSNDIECNNHSHALTFRQFLLQNRYNPHYEIVWQFVTGLLSSYPALLESFFDLLEKDPRDLIGVYHQLLVMRCFNECEAQLGEERKERLLKEFFFWMELEVESGYRNNFTPTISKQFALNASMCFKLIEVVKNESKESAKRAVSEILELQRNLPSDVISELYKLFIDKCSSKEIKCMAKDALKHPKNLPDVVVNKLCVLLKDLSKELQGDVLEILKWRRNLPPKAIFALINILQEVESKEVQYKAAEILQEQKNLPTESIKCLISWLEDEKLQKMAKTALKGRYIGNDVNHNNLLDDVAVVSKLCDLLMDASKGVQDDVLEILKHRRNLPPKAIFALINLLQEAKSDKVQYKAIVFLQEQKNLPSESIEILITWLEKEKLQEIAKKILERQRNLVDTDTKKLFNLLKKPSQEVQDSATSILCEQMNLPVGIVSDLYELLKGKESEKVQKAAAEILKRQSHRLSPEILNNLCALLMGKESEEAQGAAISVLQCCNKLPNEVMSNLYALLKDSSNVVRHAVAKSLYGKDNLPSDIVKQLIYVLLNDPPQKVQEAVCYVLGKQTMCALLNNKSDVVQNDDAKSLHEQFDLSGEILKKLCHSLKNSSAEVQNAICKVLGKQTSKLPDEIMSDLCTYFNENINDPSHVVRCAAAYIFHGQNNLSDDMLKQLCALFINDSSEDIVDAAYCVLKNHNKLPEEVMNDLYTLFKKLLTELHLTIHSFHSKNKSFKKSFAFKELYKIFKKVKLITSLHKKSNLACDIVKELCLICFHIRYTEHAYIHSTEWVWQCLRSLSKSGSEAVQDAAPDSLHEQSNLPSDIVKQIVALLNDPSTEVQYAASYVLKVQSKLPDEVMDKLGDLLKNSSDKARYVVTDILSRQCNLPGGIISILCTLLKGKESEAVKDAVAWVFEGNSNLPSDFMRKLCVLLKEERYQPVCDIFMWALQREKNLRKFFAFLEKEQEAYHSAARILRIQKPVWRLYKHFIWSQLHNFTAIYTKVLLLANFTTPTALYFEGNKLQFYMVEGSECIPDKASFINAVYEAQKDLHFPEAYRVRTDSTPGSSLEFPLFLKDDFLKKVQETSSYTQDYLLQLAQKIHKNKPVVEAIINNKSIEYIEQLLPSENSGNLFQSDELNNQLIHWAVMANRKNVVENLVSKCCGLSDAGYLGLLPVHLAVLANGTDMISYLIDQHYTNDFATVTIKEMQESIQVALNPFHVAVLAGRIDCVETFVTKNVGVSIFIEKYGNICHLAVLSGQTLMLTYLLQKLDNHYLLTQRTHSNYTVLSYAAVNNQIECLKILIDYYRSPEMARKYRNQDPLIALCHAIKNGQLEVVKTLLTMNVNPTEVVHEKGEFDSENPFLIAKKYRYTSDVISHSIYNVVRDKYYLKRVHSEYHIPNLIDSPIDNLVFQGGGVKGIAYVGALKALRYCLTERSRAQSTDAQKSELSMENVKCVAGTSAGAICACLLAIGYTVEDLEISLTNAKFEDFVDNLNTKALLSGEWKNVLKAITEKLEAEMTLYNPFTWFPTLKKLLNAHGLCAGEGFLKWLGKEIKNKLEENMKSTDNQEVKGILSKYDKKLEYLTFGDLEQLVGRDKKYKHLHVIASKLEGEDQSMEIVSINSEHSQWKNVLVIDAVRASMSIPGIFVPYSLRHINPKGPTYTPVIYAPTIRYVDGGMLKNFPIEEFDKLRYLSDSGDPDRVHQNPYTLGLSLVKQEGYKPYLMLSKEKPLKTELDNQHGDDIPLLIKHEKTIWVYGLDAKKNTKLAQSSTPTLYNRLHDGYNFNQVCMPINNISHKIYEDIALTMSQQSIGQLIKTILTKPFKNIKETEVAKCIYSIFCYYAEAETLMANYQNSRTGRMIAVGDAGISTLKFDLTETDRNNLIECGERAVCEYFKMNYEIYRDHSEKKDAPSSISFSSSDISSSHTEATTSSAGMEGSWFRCTVL